MLLSDNIKKLKGVGPKKAVLLAKLGIDTIYDLMSYYPRAYTDQSIVTPIADLTYGQDVNIEGYIIAMRENTTMRNLQILTVYIDDGTGIISATWFNKKFLKRELQVGKKIFLHGTVDYAYRGRGQLAIKNIKNYYLSEKDVPANFIPIYSLVDGLKNNFLVTLLQEAFAAIPAIPSAIPDEMQNELNLLDKKTAMYNLHFPQNKMLLKKARQMLIFEELFMIQYGLLTIQKRIQNKRTFVQFLPNGRLVEKIKKALPFTLTDEQEKVWCEIYHDMQAPHIMQRLLQGDVGSGKTVIALLSLIKSVENGFQGVFMAPTEILARQHFQYFQDFLQPFSVKVGLLVGSLTPKEHKLAEEEISNGNWQIIIGTHALIQDKVHFKNLGLVITDEQHRFGIEQRAKLETKSSTAPDVLIMTATPIPRTLTLTIYGDLQISAIKKLPPGRKPIRTFLRETPSREKIYRFIVNEVKKGRQAYIVCPLISLSENKQNLSVEELYSELSSSYLAGISMAMLHGKLPSREKETIMQDFFTGKISVLLATTVIEVGVNVPNASVMVIEGAEHFGLAQLHQLRGRIGRGNAQSYCILIAHNKNIKSKERLKLLEKTNDGFKLAEEDLRLRGAGEFFGSKQHGLPDLKIANVFSEELPILQLARNKALEYLKNEKSNDLIEKVIALQYKNNFLHIKRN